MFRFDQKPRFLGLSCGFCNSASALRARVEVELGQYKLAEQDRKVLRVLSGEWGTFLENQE